MEACGIFDGKGLCGVAAHISLAWEEGMRIKKPPDWAWRALAALPDVLRFLAALVALVEKLIR